MLARRHLALIAVPIAVAGVVVAASVAGVGGSTSRPATSTPPKLVKVSCPNANDPMSTVPLCQGTAASEFFHAGAAGGQIIGLEGNDRVAGGPGPDLVYGEEKMDGTITPGNDTIYGKGGKDSLYGGPGADLVTGGAGADLVTGGTESDLLVGGSGNDTINAIDRRASPILTTRDTIDCGSGQDVVTVDLLDRFLNRAACEQIRFEVHDGATSSTLTGGAFDDFLQGGSGDDTIVGAAGNDKLEGDAGADSLDGGDGNDTLDGMDWDTNDGVEVHSISAYTGDRITCGAGEDTVVADSKDVIVDPANCEHVTVGI